MRYEWFSRETRLNRCVAVKVLPPGLAEQSAARQRILREAHTVSSLQHPHVCGLQDIGTASGIDYLVMEFLEGETLAQRLEHGPLELDTLPKVPPEAADALETAHSRGIIYRDLKPANLLLTTSAQIKILDFGLATTQIPNPSHPTPSEFQITLDPDKMVMSPGGIISTIAYMSPE